MAYEKKTWVDRQSEYPGRRKLTATGTADVYDVAREEGLIVEEGDALNAQNLNALEERIEAGLGEKADASHTHSPNDLTAAVPVSKGGTGAATAAGARAALGAMEDAIVPITKGGTGYNNPTQATYALRKQVGVGIGSTPTTGYFPVARWDIPGTYQTIQTILAVGANGQAGNNILSINLRIASVPGTILTSETFMTWLSPSFEKTFSPENWFIDNSVAGTATLYVYLSGSYYVRNVGVIFEALSTENSANGVTLIDNYANVPVEGINYVTSITKTVTAKTPIAASTADLTAGTSALATGQLYLCYE